MIYKIKLIFKQYFKIRSFQVLLILILAKESVKIIDYKKGKEYWYISI